MAIAYDATSAKGSGSSGGTINASMTIGSITNGLLLVHIGTDAGADRVTGVTWNGVAMTRLIGGMYGQNNSSYIYTYGLLNPDTGTHTIAVTVSSTPTVVFYGVSYSGVKQSGLPDGSNHNAGSATSGSVSITTSADNCWMSGMVYTTGLSTGPTAGSGTTNRGSSSGDGFAVFDSNSAITPAGSYTLNESWTPSSDWGMVAVSFAPYVVPSTNTNFLLMF